MASVELEMPEMSGTVADTVEKQQRPDVASIPSDDGPGPNERPACFRSTTQEVIFVLTATMGIAMPSILAGATIVISSFIGSDLNMSTSEITWITASSALTSGAFLLFFGKLADLLGRRAMFIGSLFAFAAVALGTGFSKDGITLDILNAVMGLASAAAIPACQGILGSIYEKPSKRKNYAFACFSAGNPLGFVVGSIFSGIATQIFNWRASFWLLAIIYLVVTMIACFTVPKDDSEKLPLTTQTLKQFDVLGAALAILGIGFFSTGISIGPDAPDGWKTSYVLAFIIIGVLLMVAFVFWELKFEYPLMPMGVWKDREFSLLVTILLLGFIAFQPMDFFVALYFQVLSKYSALMTAVHLLPMVVSGVIVNIIAGLVLHRVSNKLLMGIGAVAYFISMLLVAVQRSGDSYWAFTFPALCLCVIGADFEFNVVNMYVLSSLPKHQQSTAGSIFQTVTKLAVTVGIAVGTAIFRSVGANPATTGYYGNDPFEPYAAVFWMATAFAFLGVLFVPFLRITTQGNEKKNA